MFYQTVLMMVVALTPQQSNATVGTVYLSPLPGRGAVISQQMIMPRFGELQINGSPHAPATLVQLIGYTGSWQSGTFNGPIGFYGEYQLSTERVATIGTYTFLKGEAFGGKLAGPLYLGFKLAGGPLEINAPHSRLVWVVSKELGAGLGWAINARSGKLTTLQIGPLVEWKHANTTARLRLGQFVAGAMIGSRQIRAEVFHSF